MLKGPVLQSPSVSTALRLQVAELELAVQVLVPSEFSAQLLPEELTGAVALASTTSEKGQISPVGRDAGV